MRGVRGIKGLRRYTLLGQAVALLVLLFGAFSIILYFDAALIGTPQDQQGYYRGRWSWLLAGILLVIFAGFCGIVASRKSRHLIWILDNVKPEPMKVAIEIEYWSDSVDYYAILSTDRKETEGKPLGKVSLYGPVWNVEVLAGRQVPAKVYLDPKTKKPAVIETEFGLLWVAAHPDCPARHQRNAPPRPGRLPEGS